MCYAGNVVYDVIDITTTLNLRTELLVFSNSVSRRVTFFIILFCQKYFLEISCKRSKEVSIFETPGLYIVSNKRFLLYEM